MQGMLQQEDDNTNMAETCAGLLGAILVMCSKYELLRHHTFSGNHPPENRYLGRTPDAEAYFFRRSRGEMYAQIHRAITQ
jgi:hypothetical protein